MAEKYLYIMNTWLDAQPRRCINNIDFSISSRNYEIQ